MLPCYHAKLNLQKLGTIVLLIGWCSMSCASIKSLSHSPILMFVCYERCLRVAKMAIFVVCLNFKETYILLELLFYAELNSFFFTPCIEVFVSYNCIIKYV